MWSISVILALEEYGEQPRNTEEPDHRPLIPCKVRVALLLSAKSSSSFPPKPVCVAPRKLRMPVSKIQLADNAVGSLVG
jgi:hypothetical protein